MRLFFLSSVVITACYFTSPIHAAYTIKDGKLISTTELANFSVQEHYGLLLSAYEMKDWEELILQCNIVLKNFPETPFASEAQFYLAVGCFNVGELEMANHQFGVYLKKQNAPKHFEEAIKYKFQIAEKFQKGSKKHILGIESLPKWIPAYHDAIEIYDEVITALPHHELAAQSLYGKAVLLLADDQFKQSVETFQALIRKFGKSVLASESYIGICKVYLQQCKKEYPDPDFLDLAELNFKKFTSEFPLEPRLDLAQNMIKEMREIYANSLFETAQFYERTKKPHASAIYYNKILVKYPSTQVALNSHSRLVYLEKKFDKNFLDSRFIPEIQSDVAKLDQTEELKSQEIAQLSIGDVDPSVVLTEQSAGMESEK